MKISKLRSFLLLLIISTGNNNHFPKAAAAPDAVVDIAGKKLRAGVNYYILPVIRRRGGGLTLANIHSSDTCPVNIVQEQLEISNGFPATFLPVNPKKGVVREFTDLNIQFEANTTCAESTVWKLDKFDESTKQWFVTIGGVRGNPGTETLDNWFKIEKNGKDYKLKFCPTVCKFCKVLCRDIGIFIKNGKRALALTDDPFPIMFKNV